MSTTTTTTVQQYREIPPGHGACGVCDEVHPLTQRHKVPASTNKYGVFCKPYLLFVHGPRGNRCLGSHTKARPWVEAARLPTWDQMSDLDKGAALMFVWKVNWESSYAYARENYPAAYIEDEQLRALDQRTACRHAAAVADSWAEVQRRIGADEVQRLYDLALDHERRERA